MIYQAHRRSRRCRSTLTSRQCNEYLLQRQSRVPSRRNLRHVAAPWAPLPSPSHLRTRVHRRPTHSALRFAAPAAHLQKSETAFFTATGTLLHQRMESAAAARYRAFHAGLRCLPLSGATAALIQANCSSVQGSRQAMQTRGTRTKAITKVFHLLWCMKKTTSPCHFRKTGRTVVLVMQYVRVRSLWARRTRGGKLVPRAWHRHR